MANTAPVSSSADWRGDEFCDSDRWIDYLSEDDIAELDAALQHAKSRGLSGIEVTRADFPLPTLSRRLQDLLDTLIDGRGFALLRGFPARDYSEEDSGTIFWGIGTYLGAPWPQNADGDLLGDVRDTGRSIADTSVRGYQTNIRLPYHTDAADLVGLMCIRAAKRGGISSLVSSIACHNEIARSRPDLLPRLYEPFYYDWREEQPEGEAPYYQMPVFSSEGGRMFNRYMRGYIETAQRFEELPRLTAHEREALNYLDKLTESDAFQLDMELQPGDMQFINNWVLLHGRTEFEDHEDARERRHLKRLWLATDRFEKRPDVFMGLGYDLGWSKDE